MKYTVVLTADYPSIARDILAGEFDVIAHPTEQARSEEEMITLLLTQRMWSSPQPPPVCRDFWTLAYQAIDD